MSTISRAVAGLGALRDSLILLGRLHALSLLGNRSMREQGRAAAACAHRLRQAQSIEEHLTSAHGERATEVRWPRGARPDERALLAGGKVSLERTAAEIDAVESLALAQIRTLEALVAAAPLLEPIALLLGPVAATLHRRASPAPARPASLGPPAATRVLRGPSAVELDPVFRKSFSLLGERYDPSLSGDELDRGPYYWWLGMREAMAAELCALCLIEYDGLPLAFYCDFSKQAWDETRHADFFVAVGLQLLPEFVAAAPAKHPLLPDARAHLELGTGLPVPLEGNLYEVALQATLVERLVLMHHDTETPGVGAFTRQARSAWCSERPAIADGIEITIHDEAAHARLGRRWLEHLAPEPDARARVIEQARAMRGFLIVHSLCAHSGDSVGDILRRFAAGSSASA